jgi:hypothetical protein
LKYIFEGDIINYFYDIMSKNFLYFSVLAGWLLEARGRRSWWCWLLLDWLAGVELHFASRTKSDRLTDDDNDVLMMNDACN